MRQPAHAARGPFSSRLQIGRETDPADRPIRETKQRSNRHGIVSGIIIPPLFGQPPAAVDCDKRLLRWPGPFGSGFLSPQPPGVVRIGPVAGTIFIRANASWSFFLFQNVFQQKPPHNWIAGVDSGSRKEDTSKQKAQLDWRAFRRRQVFAAVTTVTARRRSNFRKISPASQCNDV